MTRLFGEGGGGRDVAGPGRLLRMQSLGEEERFTARRGGSRLLRRDGLVFLESCGGGLWSVNHCRCLLSINPRAKNESQINAVC